jgi:hypothetical protein
VSKTEVITCDRCFTTVYKPYYWLLLGRSDGRSDLRVDLCGTCNADVLDFLRTKKYQE